jgi:hypothetical protein
MPMRIRLCLLALRQLVPPEVCALKLSAMVERGLACPQVQVLTGATGAVGFPAVSSG